MGLGEWPSWWDWELAFSIHAERRMFERGVTEVEVRRMLEDVRALTESPDGPRFMAHATHEGDDWVVVLEPNRRLQCLIVVTVYNVDR